MNHKMMTGFTRICGSRRLCLLLFLTSALLMIAWMQPKYILEKPIAPIEMDQPTWPLQVADPAVIARQSLYTRSMFTPEARSQNKYLATTAVVTRLLIDPRGIYNVVKHLLKYPFIKEIIVLDPFLEPPQVSQAADMEDQRLSYDMFKDLNFNGTMSNVNDDVTFHIIHDSTRNRFEVCDTDASYDTCYFQDDLGLNLYMDSLYTNYLAYPHLVHTNARIVSYIYQLKWRFHGDGIHTGYADLRYGAFVPKSAFSRLIEEHRQQQLGDNHTDAWFTIKMNRYPWLLANPLLTLGREPHTAIDPINNRIAIEKSMYEALRELKEEDLAMGDAEPPASERDVRASCGNDKCLFTTSMSSFYDDPAQINHNFMAENITSIHHWESLYEELDVPSQATWMVNAYHRAVDQDENTCWRTYHNPNIGDYFGLNLVGTMRAKRLLIRLGQPIADPEDLFTVSVARERNHWVSCRISTIKKYQTPQRLAIQIDDCPGTRVWSAIRITFTRDLQEPLEICGLAIDHMVL
ncbi:hypothetical protein BX666DRAFT_1985831 [Dichotomocladium elegans]|nr:hypothetical protein BX666DRAFT_1985831 [Dichotomocladium elegans]